MMWGQPPGWTQQPQMGQGSWVWQQPRQQQPKAAQGNKKIVKSAVAESDDSEDSDEEGERERKKKKDKEKNWEKETPKQRALRQ